MDNSVTMMVLTDVLRNQRTRVGRIAGNITLPRPVELRTLIAVSVGAFIGLLAGLTLNPGNTQAMFYGATMGGCAGWGATNWSPLQGETLATWIMLTLRRKGGMVLTSKNNERLAIGICYLPEIAKGDVKIVAGAVQVSEGSVDLRGVFKKVDEITLPKELREMMGNFSNDGKDVEKVRLSTDAKLKKRKQSTPSDRVRQAREDAESKPAPWRDRIEGDEIV